MAKRKRTMQSQAPPHSVKSSRSDAILTPPHEATPQIISHAVVSPEELEVTVDTLQTLSQHPTVIKSKICKDLRAAVWDFRQACTTGVNASATSATANLTSRISAALADGKYTDALVLLAEIRIRGETPKLGALCRWVRDLDVVSGLSLQREGVSKVATPRSTKDMELLRVLDAVMRATGPTDPNCDSTHQSSDPIALQRPWDMHPNCKVRQLVNDKVSDKSVFEHCSPGIKDQFKILETTPGPLRKPPNLHEAILYASKDDAVSLREPPQTTCHKHPMVPNLRLIKDVLTPNECASIIAAAETMTFLPDAPIRDQGEETSVLAHNFYWLVDQAFHDKLWQRVKDYVPAVSDGRLVRGINRRFRVYRYVPGAEYRCHIDGAWPPSGIDAQGKYVYDSSPSDAKQSSLYTFLIYLNDDFEGGETTFFMPSVREGVLNAYPVVPVQGSVAVFPHGEARGALLHEGTGVTTRAKYIIRTDVEYDVEPQT